MMSALSCSILTLCLMTAADEVARHSEPTSLRFEVRLGLVPGPRTGESSRTDKGPRSGRLLVVLGRAEGREPRLNVGATGMHGATILGRDVDNLAPGGTVTLDASSALFPIAHLRQLRPGTYAVQALLHTNLDLNMPNAPGDLYSKVKTVRVDPVAGGTVALELSEAVPEETLPADTELVKYLKVRSKLLSDFHGRPIYLRRRDPAPRLRS